MSELTQSRLKELLAYDPATGVFTWRISGHGVSVGKIAGCLAATGYRRIRIDSRNYQSHRLAWLYMTGDWPAAEIDHINGVRDDNRLTNLREATRKENSQNLGISPKNTSGFPGVHWNKQRRKWQAIIGKNGMRKHLGYFDTPDAAFDGYLAAKSEVHTFQPVQRGPAS